MDEDFSALSDPEFLAERRRVRGLVEELTGRLAQLDDEFIRRASVAWQESTHQEEGGQQTNWQEAGRQEVGR